MPRVEQNPTTKMQFTYPWSGAPNLAGELFGVVEAVWLDKDGHIMIAVADPHGNVFETWLTHVTVNL